jgi:hypothetical protein
MFVITPISTKKLGKVGLGKCIQKTSNIKFCHSSVWLGSTLYSLLNFFIYCVTSAFEMFTFPVTNKWKLDRNLLFLIYQFIINESTDKLRWYLIHYCFRFRLSMLLYSYLFHWQELMNLCFKFISLFFHRIIQHSSIQNSKTCFFGLFFLSSAFLPSSLLISYVLIPSLILIFLSVYILAFPINHPHLLLLPYTFVSVHSINFFLRFLSLISSFVSFFWFS